MSEEFSWDPRGEAFWLEAQKTSGATDLQVRFACCRARGMTATAAARAAGYGGDDDNIRQAGHRAAKSTAVMNMLALAQAEPPAAMTARSGRRRHGASSPAWRAAVIRV
jgi:hypothetical protein